jgi:hypothetical protein
LAGVIFAGGIQPAGALGILPICAPTTTAPGFDASVGETLAGAAVPVQAARSAEHKPNATILVDRATPLMIVIPLRGRG